MKVTRKENNLVDIVSLTRYTSHNLVASTSNRIPLVGLWNLFTGLLFPILMVSSSSFAQEEYQDDGKEEIYQRIDEYLQLSSDYVNENLDSAIYYGEQSNALIEQLDSDSARAQVYANLGSVYRARGSHAISLDYLFRAQRLTDKILDEFPENTNILLLKIQILDLIGINYFFQRNYVKALDYYENALDLVYQVKQIDSSKVKDYEQIKLFNNIAGIYIREKKYEQAIEYNKTSIDLLGDDNRSLLAASLFNNQGICYMEKFDHEMAFHYFQKALDIRREHGETRGVAQCYNNIAKNYFYQKKYPEAKEAVAIALDMGRKIGHLESMRISLQLLTAVHDTTGNIPAAYASFREYKTISDSLFNSESVARIAQSELQHEFEQQQRIFDLEIRRREAEEQKRTLIYLSIAGILFFSLITAVLFVILQRNKIKQSNLARELLELEHKTLNLEKEKLKEQLDFKNRELTTNVMYLLKKNELITNISEKLIKSKLEFKKENQRIIQEIINELRSSQDSDTWEEFEAYFTQVHTGFYDKLNHSFPNLSANEKKLCAFLRLNMSTKDIAAITYQSVNSITVARSRLRKKLSIEGEDVNLVNFLSRF
jgi:tetratricopeptide (TPR) repeat protein